MKGAKTIMKFTTNIGNLKQALSEVNKGLGDGKNIEVFSGILIETDNDLITLTTTDGTVRIEKTLQAKIYEQGVELVSADLFSGVINQLNSNDTCEFSTKDNILHIKSKNVNVKQKCLDSSNYPSKKNVSGALKSVTVDTNEFIAAINKASICASKDGLRQILCGVNLSFSNDSLVMVGCDGYRLAKSKIDCAVNGAADYVNNVTVPSKVIAVIQSVCGSGEKIEFVFDEISLRIKTDTALIVANLLSGEYISVNKIIPNGFKFSAVVDTSDIKQALALSQVVGRGEKQNIIKINICNSSADDFIKILSSANVAESEFEVKSEFDGSDIENFTIALNANYVVECLKTIKDEKIRLNFNNPNQPVVITANENNDYLFLILPVRII